MGSSESDPLPAGFEIRFGSLNFHATGNGYLMRLTNCDELRARWQTGSVPVSAAPAATTPTPASIDVASPSAPRRRRCSGQHSRQARTEHRHATRVAFQRGAHRRDDGRPEGGALGLRTVSPHRSTRCYDGVCHLRQHQRGDAQGSPWSPCSGRQGPRRFRRRRVVPRLRHRAATRHFARVRGV
jgi:hypothetical protein